MRASFLALLAGLLVAASGCAHAPLGRREGRWVEAEGLAGLEPGRALEARERALAEALRSAVEKAVGVTLSARTRVSKALSVEQKIEALAAGSVGRYEVLLEAAEGGLFKIRIRALVLAGEPPAARELPADLRVAVSILEGALAAAVRLALAEKGFQVAEEGREAEVTVTGEAQAFPAAGISGFHSYRARVALEGRLRRGGLAYQAREASAMDPVAAIAREKAVEEAARLAWEGLAESLASEIYGWGDGR